MSHPDLKDKHKRQRKTWLVVSAAVIACVLFVTLVIVQPATPNRILLLTGPEKSAYHELGKRYARNLRRRGLEAEVVVTEGALDNVRSLAEGKSAVAIAPATVKWSSTAGIDASHLVTLGSVGFEPLWLFYRSDLEINRISDLAGRNVVTEGRGTSSEYVARLLIDHNGLAGEVEIQHRTGQTAEALLQGFAAGTIDAGFVTGDVSSPVVNRMLAADKMTFLSFDRADAYVELIPGVTKIVAPEGVFDLARNVPPGERHDVRSAIDRPRLHRLPPVSPRHAGARAEE